MPGTIEKKSIRYFFLFSIYSLLLPLPAPGGDIITSPDKSIVVLCHLQILPEERSNEVRFTYDVTFRGIRVIENTPLDFDLLNGSSIHKDFRIYKLQRTTVHDTLDQPFGPRRIVPDHYNQMTIGLQEQDPPFRIFEIIFRVADDGVAFRYVFPRQKNLDQLNIVEENTRFRFPDNYTAYMLPLESFSTHYENNYQTVSIRDIQPETLIGLPLLLNTHQGIWMAISEANLTDYAGMYLRPCGKFRNTLKSALSPGQDVLSPKVRGSTPFQTPWRVILLGEKPGDLIESDFIFTLNDSCEIRDTSWIKPGKCAWPWWSGRHVEGVSFQGGMNTSTMLHYLDFASEQGLEYLLIDAGWYGIHNNRSEDITRPVPEIDLQHIISEGKRKNVGIWLWLFWECVADQMDQAFSMYEAWGVSGVKIDYMNRDDQDMVLLYRSIVEKAAEHHLLVDFHGAYKPTGIRRTYPNCITREGVLGLEWSKWTKRCDPEHELIIPFTRMLAGPMDFTPGCFRTALKETFEPDVTPPQAMGTRCHQLAMYVIYDSPLQMCVDYPDSYRNQAGTTFLQSVPTIWDETRVLSGEVGDFIVMARRSGRTWFVGAMTDWTARELFIPLDFLGQGMYEAEIYSDKADVMINPMGVLIRRAQVQPTDQLIAPLGPGGGYVVKLVPMNREFLE